MLDIKTVENTRGHETFLSAVGSGTVCGPTRYMLDAETDKVKLALRLFDSGRPFNLFVFGCRLSAKARISSVKVIGDVARISLVVYGNIEEH